MLMFTLVSLMLALFGSSFAAITALRTYQDAEIKKRCADRDAHAKQFERYEKHDNKAFVDSFKERFDKPSTSLSRWAAVWKFAQLTPTALFLIFANYMAWWAIVFWDRLGSRQDWVGWRCIVGTAAVINLTSVLMMIASWKRVRALSITLDKEVEHSLKAIPIKSDQTAP